MVTPRRPHLRQRMATATGPLLALPVHPVRKPLDLAYLESEQRRVEREERELARQKMLLERLITQAHREARQPLTLNS